MRRGNYLTQRAGSVGGETARCEWLRLYRQIYHRMHLRTQRFTICGCVPPRSEPDATAPLEAGEEGFSASTEHGMPCVLGIERESQ